LRLGDNDGSILVDIDALGVVAIGNREVPVRYVSLSAFPLASLLTAAALAGPPQQGRAPVEGGSLFYQVTGQGEAVVLIHGGMLDHRAWQPQVDALARRYRVVTYDVAGHGQSPAPDRPWRYVDQLLALLGHLGIERATLVGHSLGARIAVDFAIAHPERVERLVLIGPGLSGFPFTGRDWSEAAAVQAAARRAGDADRAADYFMRSWVAGPHRTPAQVDPTVWKTLQEIARPNALSTAWGGELEPPAVGRLAEVRAPTLILEGELDCEDIHLIGRLLERRVAGARRVVLPGVAHMPGMEAPLEVNRLILDFLRAPAVAPAAAPGKPAEQAFVEVPGGRLWAERQGAAEAEAVLLVHDGIVHSALWDDVAPLLATQYSVIRFDRRGFGRSDPPGAPYSELDDVEAVLRHFGVTKVNLVGSSAGAALCIDYALAHPGQVLSLTLVGPVVSGLALNQHLFDRGRRLTAEIWKDRARFRQYWTTTDPFYLAPESTEARARVAALLAASPQNLELTGTRPVVDPPPALPRLHEIRVPVLIVVGEHDIPDVHAHAGVIELSVADARRIVVPHAGHAVPLEQPEQVTLQLLEQFQDRAFLTVLSNQGAESAAELLRSARRADPAAVLVSEEALNRRGYERLQAGRTAEAVAILRLGVEAFPASPNAHDSLGEALLANGERAAAAAEYRRALEIDPAIPSARKALSELEAKPARE